MLRLNTIEQEIINGTLGLEDLRNLELCLLENINKIKDEIHLDMVDKRREMLGEEVAAFEEAAIKVRSALKNSLNLE